MTSAKISNLSGQWHIWFDEDADWANEPIHLPRTPLSSIAATPPTGGWHVLQHAEPITVPAITDDARGDYHGVSWWSRTIELSGRASALLRFCAVRLRAEIFLDGELIGYDLEGYTPFEIAIPEHLNTAGSHRLDIRVTNPGGSDNWEDLNPIRWSGMTLPSSQDFGGIWQPVYLIEHDGLRIADLWVKCDFDSATVSVSAELEGGGAQSAELELFAPDGAEVYRQRFAYDTPQQRIAETAILQSILPHGIGAPNLYRAVLRVANEALSDEAGQTSGFRKLVSSDGRLLYNNTPVYLATSISWGLYSAGPIGTAEEIAREVAAIEAMGQNMLTAHRRPANPALIDALDAAGIMLYQEPGGLPALRDRMGCGEWLPENQLSSAMAFAALRIERLWRRDRSRASLVWWNLANECLDVGDGNPGAPAHILLATARANDDSRTTTWTSGWGPGPAYEPAAEAPTASFDYHTVLNWPSLWHPQLDAEIAAIRPLKPMPYIAGESQNFTSLAGLGELTEAAKNRNPQRHFDRRYTAWHSALSDGLARIDPPQMLGGADGFCSATAQVQSEGVARLVRHHRANADCDGLAINGWHSHPLIGTMGIMRIDRKPAVDMGMIAQANAPMQIMLQGMRYDVAAGATIYCQPVILNNVHAAGLPVQLHLTIDGRVVSPPIVGQTDSQRAQPLAEIALTLPQDASGVMRVSIAGKVGNAAVADIFDIIATPVANLDATGIHVFDPRSELAGIVEGIAQPWRMGSAGPALICANNHRLLQALFDEPLQRTAVLMRPELPGATNILGGPSDFAKHGLASADARFVPVKGDWNGGWAFSTGSALLPSLGKARLWSSSDWHLFPSQMLAGVNGDVLTGAVSFEDATLYETGNLCVGATTMILTKGQHQMLLTCLPLIDAAPRSALARSVIGDILNWLRAA
jgi:hypothetical protein